MTQDKYLELMYQLGKDPIEEEIPPDWSDFPYEVQEAINIYNMLGDRIAADIGFLGKDYTNLLVILEVFEVEDKSLLLEILSWLDHRNIKKSNDNMKKQYDKMKNKGKKK